MQEWARGEERSCCDLVNQYHRRNSEMVKKKRWRELQLLCQIRRGIGYRPLPHRIVVFRKEDINPKGQRVSNYGQQRRDRQDSIASGRNSLSANFVPAQGKTQP